MNIQEGNKLIAEFMGMVAQSTDVWADAKTGSIVILGEYRPHKDWNELMPVVEKIKDVVSEAGQNGYVETYSEKTWGSEVKIWGRDILEPIIRYKSNESFLDAHWNACVDFITWYNTH